MRAWRQQGSACLIGPPTDTWARAAPDILRGDAHRSKTTHGGMPGLALTCQPRQQQVRAAQHAHAAPDPLAVCTSRESGSAGSGGVSGITMMSGSCSSGGRSTLASTAQTPQPPQGSALAAACARATAARTNKFSQPIPAWLGGSPAYLPV